MPQKTRNCSSPAAIREQQQPAGQAGDPGIPGRAVLVEVYLLRGRPDGLVAYRRAAGRLGPGETPDAAAWRIGMGPDAQRDEPIAVLHSTSWRHLSDGTIVLTYAALPDPEQNRPATPIRASKVARSADPRRPSPPQVRHGQVAAHAARHLALIADTDPLVRLALDRSPELARALTPLARLPAGQLTH